MKKFLLSLILALGVAIPGFAEELKEVASMPLVLTSLWPNNSSYTATTKSLVGGWTAYGFNNNNLGWNGEFRCGRKGSASTAYITKDNPIEEAVSQVILYVGTKVDKQPKSIKLYVADNKNFTGAQTYSFEGTFNATTGEKAFNVSTEYTLSLPTPQSNCYYKVEFDMASQSANGVFSIGGKSISALRLFASDEVAPKDVEDVAIAYEINDKYFADVTLSCATEGATIKYGTSKDALTETYTGPFEVSESCTIYAQASKDGKEGDVTSKEITLPSVLRSMKAVVDYIKGGNSTELVAVGNMSVAYVTDKYAIVTDGISNAMLYTSGHGYKADTKISKFTGTPVFYNNYLPEVSKFTLTEGGEGAECPLHVIDDLSTISLDNNLFDKVEVQGASISGVSNKNATLKLGDKTIALYNDFGIDGFEKGENLTVTGFVWCYKNASQTDITLQIVPISIVEGPQKADPELSFAQAEQTFDISEQMAEGQLVNAPEGVDQIAYTSSDPDGLFVEPDGSSLYFYAPGEYTITATSAETANYQAGTATYKVIVTDTSHKAVTLTWSVNDIEVIETTVPEQVTLSIEPADLEDLVIEYSSTDKEVAYFDGTKNELVIGKPGTVTITATATGDYTGSASFTVTVTEAPRLGAITVNGQTANDDDEIEVTIYVGGAITISAENALKLTYTDDEHDEDVPVDGDITFDAKGKYYFIITATGYKDQSEIAFLTVNVKRPLPVSNTYEKVVSDAQIVEGGQYVFVSVPMQLGKTPAVSYGAFALGQAKSNGKGFDGVSIDNIRYDAGESELELQPSYEITNGDVTIFTLEAADNGKWYFNSDNGYLDGSADKALKLGDKDAMTISTSEGKTTISATSGTIQFVAQNSSGRQGSTTFNNYTTNQKAIILYKRVPAVDASKVTPVFSDETFTVAPNGDGGYDVTITHDAEYDDISIHYLHTPAQAAEQARRRAIDHGNFSKATTTDGVNHTFSVDGPGTIEYYGYHADTDTKGTVESFAIDAEGNTTSIESIMLDGVDPSACYDLQGRRIARPTRGLYIRNGQKLLVR